MGRGMGSLRMIRGVLSILLGFVLLTLSAGLAGCAPQAINKARFAPVGAITQGHFAYVGGRTVAGPALPSPAPTACPAQPLACPAHTRRLPPARDGPRMVNNQAIFVNHQNGG